MPSPPKTRPRRARRSRTPGGQAAMGGGGGSFALAGALALDGVLLPKVESAEAVRAAAARTRHPLWCMIETPLGVLRAGEIAAASDRLAGFVAGTNDLSKDLRARQTAGRTPLLASLSLLLLAARAYGMAAIDGVHLDLDDAAGFEA